jgi:hypothetical protein
MSGNGKGGNNRRRPNKHRERNTDDWKEFQPNFGKNKQEKPRFDKNRGVLIDRPRWIPAKPADTPLPSPDCPVCGRPIKDIASAITDKTFGSPVHFDCMIARLSEHEVLEKGDAVAYIGGGRFGVVHFTAPPDAQGRPGNNRNFKILKIFETEDKENRADWRKDVADHYSVT